MNNFLPSKNVILWACIWGLVFGIATEKIKQISGGSASERKIQEVLKHKPQLSDYQ